MSNGKLVGGLSLTGAASQLLDGAAEEAARLGHGYVGTEHLVLALTRPPHDAALARFGIDLTGVHGSIAGAVPTGTERAIAAPDRPYTSRTRNALTLAADSARERGQVSVDVPHLLVGLLREGWGIGAQVLHHHGLTLERVEADAS
jgi:ATP-dependent Clp protease ATP-binding subunit ClpC